MSKQEKINLVQQIREFLDKYREDGISLYVEDLSNGYTQPWSELPLRYLKSWYEGFRSDPKTGELVSNFGWDENEREITLRTITLFCADLALRERGQYVITTSQVLQVGNNRAILYYNTASPEPDFALKIDLTDRGKN